jgi:hypothetical protein
VAKHTRGSITIRTEYVFPAIPIRTRDWAAYDDDTYDGAPDSPPQIVGWGRTEQEAIDDFMEQKEASRG